MNYFTLVDQFGFNFDGLANLKRCAKMQQKQKFALGF